MIIESQELSRSGVLQQRLLMAILVFLLGGLPAAQPSPQPAPTAPQAVRDWTQDLH